MKWQLNKPIEPTISKSNDFGFGFLIYILGIEKKINNTINKLAHSYIKFH